MGYPKSKDKIYLVTFLYGLSLEKEAEMMKKIGCYEAMNLDGGASRALAHNGSIIIKAGRPLTNVLIVYDKPIRPAKHREILGPLPRDQSRSRGRGQLTCMARPCVPG